MFSAGVIAASDSDANNIFGKFTFTAGVFTADFGKNVQNGFMSSSVVPIGSLSSQSVSLATFSIDVGISADDRQGSTGDRILDNNGNEGDKFFGTFIILNGTFPARTEANFFKSMRFINLNDGNVATLAFDDITFDSPATYGSGQKLEYSTGTGFNAGITNGHQSTIQFRKD